jgi:hypothetical protein
MHVLDTGRYTITNAKYGNVAVLYDGNEDSEVVAGYQEDKPGEKVLYTSSHISHIAHNYDLFSGMLYFSTTKITP